MLPYALPISNCLSSRLFIKSYSVLLIIQYDRVCIANGQLKYGFGSTRYNDVSPYNPHPRICGDLVSFDLQLS